MLKMSIFDRRELTVEEIDMDGLAALAARPNGVVLVMSAFRRGLDGFEGVLRTRALPGRPAIVKLLKSRYASGVADELSNQLIAGISAAQSVIGITDQPWYTLHPAGAESTSLRELIELVEGAGAQFTTVYVGPRDLSEADAVQRYRRWVGDYHYIHGMPEAERGAFFGLPPDYVIRDSADKAKFKDRLGDARTSYCQALLRVISTVFAHLERTRDQTHWCLLALAVAADFAEKSKSLRQVVAEELQPRGAGWGVETYGGGKFGKLQRTTRALSLLLKDEALPEACAAGLVGLVPLGTAFSVVAGWAARHQADSHFPERVASVERVTRATRNAIEHDEGVRPTPLFRSSLEQVTVAAEELARLAQQSMPTGPDRWRLGNEGWMSTLAELSADQAKELSDSVSLHLGRRLQQRLRELGPAAAQAADVQALFATRAATARGSAAGDVSRLLHLVTRLEQGDISELQQSTGWMGWSQIIPLRGNIARLLLADG